MSVDLVFHGPPHTDPASAVVLVFGLAEVPVPMGLIAVDLSAPPVTAIVMLSAVLASVAVDLSAPPVIAIEVDIDNAVYRGPRRSVGARWENASALHATTATVWAEATRLPRSFAQTFIDATPVHDAPISAAWEESARTRRLTSTTWQEAERLRVAPTHIVAQESVSMPLRRTTRWQEARAVRPPTTTMVWQEARRVKRTKRAVWQEAKPLEHGVTSKILDAEGLVRSWKVLWQEAKLPEPGKSAIVPPPPPPPDLCYTPPLGSDVELTYTTAWPGPQPTELTFVCDNHPPVPPATVTVPIREVYMVSNDVSLTLADGTQIPTTTFTLTLDYQSWTWGLQATVAYTALSVFGFDESGDPVQVWAHINGQVFKLFVQVGVSARQYGSSANITLTGIGLISTLDAPYSPTLTFDNTAGALNAQQIANAVLTDNGVSIGWAVDWELVDWLVPQSAWSFQGTYAQALQAIAAAVGGYLQPHPTDLTARMLPLYPTAPWDWSTVTPDYELPSSVTFIEGITWSSQPEYNGVFVAGANSSGVLGNVTRSGTAGDLQATMVTDQLITHEDAARARGIAILANTGKQALVSIQLPVLPETGVILPGKFVRYVDAGVTRIGIVRSIEVDVNLPAVWQIIGVETHVG